MPRRDRGRDLGIKGGGPFGGGGVGPPGGRHAPVLQDVFLGRRGGEVTVDGDHSKRSPRDLLFQI